MAGGHLGRIGINVLLSAVEANKLVDDCVTIPPRPMEDVRALDRVVNQGRVINNRVLVITKYYAREMCNFILFFLVFQIQGFF
jgi:hypothetical protein